MKFKNVRELKNHTSEVLRNAEKEDIVITSNGKPRAILSAVTEEDFEDYLLENSPAFQRMIEKAHQEYLEKGGLTLAEFRRKHKLSA